VNKLEEARAMAGAPLQRIAGGAAAAWAVAVSGG
jgi:hypothetical protein